MKKTITITIIAIIVLVGVGYGVWMWQGNPDVALNEQASTSTQQVSDEYADWKVYKNETYGFEFKYPKDWGIKEEIYNSNMGEGACETIESIELINKSLGKQVYEAAPPGENVNTYVEKYGSVPILAVNVRKNDCNNEKNLGSQAKDILSKLKNEGVSSRLAVATVSLLPGYGELISEKPNVWEMRDGCRENNLLTVNGSRVIKSIGCIEGVVQNTFATFVSEDRYIIQIRDSASEYERSGYFDKILATFKLTK